MKRLLILGAAGRDFHNFNVLFRNNPDYEVIAFTATQIPDIAGRRYPTELADGLYPQGIRFRSSRSARFAWDAARARSPVLWPTNCAGEGAGRW